MAACPAAALVALGATGIALAAARGPGSQRPTAAPPGRGSPSGPPTGRRRPAGRGGSGRAGPSSAERKADLRLEGEFLQKMSEGGIGSQIEALALADSVAALRVLPPSQKRQNLGGDWRLAASDAGDLLVQFGSGLHGMPFTAVSDMWLSLRPSQKESRTTEILQMGPSKITNMLKGELSLGAVGEEEIVMEYVGMVDNNGVYKATGGSTRKVTASPLYAGERSGRVGPQSGALRRGSVQTGVSQSARSCRILQRQGRIDPGLGAGVRRILQEFARPD
ncbi:unnamed protein product [Prorocentrum cordatum]|uniref:Peptidylprolyl isomerase n=1 Tax=Prorocentrum cordatum TaxID=2364126 RepID=A0ABN9TEY9_9DINO|nr:unnamed protein product [Polarella glacialis]